MHDALNSHRMLEALVDRIIPADDYPSGWQAGVGDFIQRLLSTDLIGSRPLLETGLDWLAQESAARYDGISFADIAPKAQDVLIEDLLVGRTVLSWTVPAQDFTQLIIRLTIHGFYSDPANGGNRAARAWTMIGYRSLPEHAVWPKVDIPSPRTISWNSVKDTYDYIVVGAGAGGGVTACVLAEAGSRVLLVERGDWLLASELRPDHLRNQRTMLGYDTPAGPPSEGNPRVLSISTGDIVVAPPDPRWSNNAMTVGGGTRVYGAQAWRFSPEDFRMATTYGVPAASSLADWPISYEDLEPYYSRAEWEIGVSGDPSGDSASGPRSRSYPMPPLPNNVSGKTLSSGAQILGLKTGPVPLMINSVARDGREACVNCGTCVGFGCPGESKSGTHNTVIQRAIATGRCDVLINVQAERLLTDTDGEVIGVALVTDIDGAVQRRTITAKQTVLSAGAIETARLLLNSRSEREANGIGNNHDQVGRNLQSHVYAGAIGLFDEVVQDCYGPGPTISINDYRHHNEGIIGGGMIANDFVPTPLATWTMLTSLGVIPRWGAESKRGMRDLYTRHILVTGPGQEMPNPEARVTLDPVVRDKFGMPVVRLSGNTHPEDDKTSQFMSDKASAWLKASGAKTIVPLIKSTAEGPNGGQHQAGTCRMGSDPASSVTDKWGQVWGHRHLHIVDASLHVTNGGVNPVLTILANAYRISEHLANSAD
jgi:choline dehydrogenase-like flavoprotein